MDLSWRHDFWYWNLRASPREEGEVRGIVIRPLEGGAGARRILEQVRVTPEQGLEGDRWSEDEKATGQDQITLINVHVLQSVAGSDPAELARSGDNLQVDLDLTERNLPVGTRLEIGSAVLEVSPQPHTPCKKFHRRYGGTAVRRVIRANRKGRRGRGVLCLVVEAGEISVGDRIRVQRPIS